MPDKSVIYWRDIPAEVIVREGRHSLKRELPERFIQAIDRCAMRVGARDSEAYLAEWRREKATPCTGSLEEALERAVSDLLARYDTDRLQRLIDNGGRESAPSGLAPRQNTKAGTHRVVFLPSGRRGDFAVGTKLLDAARSLGVYVESVCGGRGLCGRCQIQPAHGIHAKLAIESMPGNLSEIDEVERRYASTRNLAAGRRLSCQARIQGDLVVEVPEEGASNRQIVRKSATARRFVRDCATHLHYIEVEPPDMTKPRGELDRVLAHLRHEHGIEAIDIDSHLLAELQPVLDAGERKITVALHADQRRPTIVAFRAGYRERLLGIACDIGSTTIACHLVDFATGEIAASAGMANPQIRFGEDLMSRVSYAMLNTGGRQALTASVRSAVSELIGRVAQEARAENDEILEAVFVGNPVMHHLFLGLDPTPLGQAPFTLAVSGAVTLPAHELDLPLVKGARAYFLPCIAGHVGADAAAVALADGPQYHDEATLVVDIGTNAEILLGSKERLFAASSPTGPAFEGAQISCGQRAAPGAIERVRIDPETYEPRIRVIGAQMWSHEPGFAEATARTGVTGICGSGIIEAIAEMFLAGIVKADGVIDGSLARRSPRIIAEGRTFAYRLWDGAPPVIITQADIRAVQLAKGALYAGISLLKERAGIAQIERIKLAGAFGTHIDPKYAMILGLIPDCSLDKVSAIGNAASTGACMALVNRGHRRAIEALVLGIEKVETALEPRFQSLFVDAMGIPNGVDAFPELSKHVSLPPAPAALSGSKRRGSRASRKTSPSAG